MEIEDKPIAELIALEVDEISVVDSPANLVEFAVMKCTSTKEDKMADENADVKKSAEGKGDQPPQPSVETVSVDVAKSDNAAVLAAMAQVQDMVKAIAGKVEVQKAVSTSNMAAEPPKEEVKVEKKTEEATPKTAEITEPPKEEVKVEKGAETKAEISVEQAIDVLKSFIASISATAPSKPTEVAISKSVLDEINARFEILSGKVEKIEKLRQPPASSGDDIPVEKTGARQFWASVFTQK